MQDFNSTAYRANLAALLEVTGVLPSDIELSVTAASVVVTARIRANSTVADAVIGLLATLSQGSNATAVLSDLLGITVIRVERPTGSRSHTPPIVASGGMDLTGGGDSQSVIEGVPILVVIFVTVPMLACMVGVCVYLRRSQSASRLGLRRFQTPSSKGYSVYDIDVTLEDEPKQAAEHAPAKEF